MTREYDAKVRHKYWGPGDYYLAVDLGHEQVMEHDGFCEGQRVHIRIEITPILDNSEVSSK